MKGSITLVTGGASGLGKATAEHLTELGSFVVIADLPTSKGEEVAKILGENKCVFVPTNVTVEEDVKNLFEIIKNKLGKLNYVVNCSGVFGAEKLYDPKTQRSHSIKLFTHTLEVNVVGTFNIIRLAVPLMTKNELNQDGERGVIINTASVAAYDGQIGTIAYSASKGAVVSMTLPLTRELAVHGIRVCAIAPGFFDTAMVANIQLHLKPTIKSSLLSSIMFPKRFGFPREFAQLIQTIIENPMLNGEVIRLDAGLRMPSGKL